MLHRWVAFLVRFAQEEQTLPERSGRSWLFFGEDPPKNNQNMKNKQKAVFFEVGTFWVKKTPDAGKLDGFLLTFLTDLLRGCLVTVSGCPGTKAALNVASALAGGGSECPHWAERLEEKHRKPWLYLGNRCFFFFFFLEFFLFKNLWKMKQVMPFSFKTSFLPLSVAISWAN